MVFPLLVHLEHQDRTVRMELMGNQVHLVRMVLMDHHLRPLLNVNSASTAPKVPWDHPEIRDQRDPPVILAQMGNPGHLGRLELLGLKVHLDLLETTGSQEILALQELLVSFMKFLAPADHPDHLDFKDLLDLTDNLEWMDNLDNQDHKGLPETMEQ